MVYRISVWVVSNNSNNLPTLAANWSEQSTPFCTPNRHFFIWFRHIAIDFVTTSLGLNRGSHYELVHTCLTKRTTVWLGSYNRIIDRGHSISAGASALSKLNARCRLYDPSRAVVHYLIQVCPCRKRPPRFQTNTPFCTANRQTVNWHRHCAFSFGSFTLKGLTQLWKSRRIYPKYMSKCSVGSTDHVCKFLLKNFA